LRALHDALPSYPLLAAPLAVLALDAAGAVEQHPALDPATLERLLPAARVVAVVHGLRFAVAVGLLDGRQQPGKGIAARHRHPPRLGVGAGRRAARYLEDALDGLARQDRKSVV